MKKLRNANALALVLVLPISSRSYSENINQCRMQHKLVAGLRHFIELSQEDEIMRFVAVTHLCLIPLAEEIIGQWRLAR